MLKTGSWGKRAMLTTLVSMSVIYFKLIGVMKKSNTPKAYSQSGMIGMSWASTGGEASALFNDEYLAADGIENVIHVLDEIETGHFPMLQFVELNACPGGCVGRRRHGGKPIHCACAHAGAAPLPSGFTEPAR